VKNGRLTNYAPFAHPRAKVLHKRRQVNRLIFDGADRPLIAVRDDRPLGDLIKSWHGRLARGFAKAGVGVVLLSNVNLLFFVDVTKEINQSANKEYDRAANGPPHVMRSCFRAGSRNEEVELVDPKTQCRKTYDYGKSVFQASHFEPPNDLLSNEGLRKSRAFYECFAGLHVNAIAEGKARPWNEFRISNCGLRSPR
jgi:hypothetical protein